MDEDDFLAQLRARARSWLEGASEARDAVPHDYFDEATHSEVREGAGDYRAQIEEYAKDYDYVQDFFCDLFYLLHKGDPQVRERGEMAATHVPNREMIEAFAQLQDVKDLRDFTRGDPFATAMGIGSMDSEIADALAKMKAAQELAEELAKLHEAIKEAAQAALTEGDPEALAELIAAGMDAQGEAVGVAEALDEATAQMVASALPGLRSGAAKAAAEAAQEAELASMFGVAEGELQRMDAAERAQLALRLRSSRMAKFTQLFGAMRMLSMAARRRRVENVPSEIAGLETTDDLARLAPMEYLNLASAELESDFWLRFANHQLATWRLHGSERQGRGPIIAVVDESGSMATPDIGGNTREAWSKAFVLALADMARREGRHMIYIGFSSRGQLFERDLTAGGASAVWEVCEHFWAGGTHFEAPLSAAMEAAVQRREVDAKDRPDIVFITDDEYATMHPRFVSAFCQDKEKLSAQVFGVLIGGRDTGALASVADPVVAMDDLVGAQSVAADIFRAMRPS